MTIVIRLDMAEAVDKASVDFQSLEDFLASPGERPVLLAVDEEVERIANHLPVIPEIALDFPTFFDGRHYSSAQILRKNYGYEGDIRAVGDVRVDQLEQMVRCGFNVFELADGQDPAIAREKLQGFSYSYQPTVDRDPLFLKR